MFYAEVVRSNFSWFLAVKSKSKSELLNLIKICICLWFSASVGSFYLCALVSVQLATLHTVFSWAISSLMPKISTAIFLASIYFETSRFLFYEVGRRAFDSRDQDHLLGERWACVVCDLKASDFIKQ